MRPSNVQLTMLTIVHKEIQNWIEFWALTSNDFVCTFRFKSINNNISNTWTLCMHFYYILIQSFSKKTQKHTQTHSIYTFYICLDCIFFSTMRNILTSLRLVRIRNILVNLHQNFSFLCHQRWIFHYFSIHSSTEHVMPKEKIFLLCHRKMWRIKILSNKSAAFC